MLTDQDREKIVSHLTPTGRTIALAYARSILGLWAGYIPLASLTGIKPEEMFKAAEAGAALALQSYIEQNKQTKTGSK